jgi:hypothetical protein
MAGLDPAIHVFAMSVRKTWMPGSSPGMTVALSQLEQRLQEIRHRLARKRPAASQFGADAADLPIRPRWVKPNPAEYFRP